MTALPRSRRLASFPDENNYERFDSVIYIVTKDDIFVGHGEHNDLAEEEGFDDSNPENWPSLNARYFPSDIPGDDALWLSMEYGYGPRDILPGGRYEDHFNRLYSTITHLGESVIGPKTRVSFDLGMSYRILGDILAMDRKYAPVQNIPQQSIEGYYPSGRPIRLGDRRPVHVRNHRRRA